MIHCKLADFSILNGGCTNKCTTKCWSNRMIFNISKGHRSSGPSPQLPFTTPSKWARSFVVPILKPIFSIKMPRSKSALRYVFCAKNRQKSEEIIYLEHIERHPWFGFKKSWRVSAKAFWEITHWGWFQSLPAQNLLWKLPWGVWEPPSATSLQHGFGEFAPWMLWCSCSSWFLVSVSTDFHFNKNHWPQELDQLVLFWSSSPVVVRHGNIRYAHGLGQVECTQTSPSSKKMRFLQDRLSLMISSLQDSSVIPSQPISFRHRLVSQGILQGSAWCKQISTDFLISCEFQTHKSATPIKPRENRSNNLQSLPSWNLHVNCCHFGFLFRLRIWRFWCFQELQQQCHQWRWCFSFVHHLGQCSKPQVSPQAENTDPSGWDAVHHVVVSCQVTRRSTLPLCQVSHLWARKVSWRNVPHSSAPKRPWYGPHSNSKAHAFHNSNHKDCHHSKLEHSTTCTWSGMFKYIFFNLMLFFSTNRVGFDQGTTMNCQTFQLFQLKSSIQTQKSNHQSSWLMLHSLTFPDFPILRQQKLGTARGAPPARSTNVARSSNAKRWS